MLVSRIYLGLNTPNGDNFDKAVEEREAWIATECEELFPQGCTTYDAVGIWKGDQERVIIVEIMHTSKTPADTLAKLGIAYKNYARQEAVFFTQQEITAVTF